ncbi:ATP-dependent zinc protease [Catenovulum sp. 2E275]|uniref:ATP-dependent zinc protease family protein n=1 Tax=Catenovulum sp. 2E275 TaxID=2980497 RepID=UPI0021CFBB38|nr:ATP-dependent zinc protease [Catenovulum sp. 2E275]MCU4676295.1 ATP-dependent zinc protease [Catenovulum sp. 2E275]
MPSQINLIKTLTFVAALTSISACTSTSQTQTAETPETNQPDINQTITEQMSVFESQLLGQCQTRLDTLEAKIDNQQQQNTDILQAAKSIEARLIKHQAQPHNAKLSCPEPKKVIEPKLDGKVIVGELEWVYFPIIDEHFKARVDSGATTSSLSAKHIVEFERDGEEWVRFQLLHQVTDLDGREIEAKIERTVRIRQSSSDETERRHVVKLSINLGNLHQIAEFTLADRSDMDYPILLGREFLQDLTLIDVGRTFIHPKYKKSETK